MQVESKRPLVALVDSQDLRNGPWLECLSGQELADYRRFGSERRQQEWLAGRIAAKYVYLQQGSPLAGLVSANVEMLTHFDPAAYRETVVVRNESPEGGPVRVGQEMLETAISHVKGLACATTASGPFRSIDIESNAARVPAFYTENFSAREREWALDASGRLRLDLDWLYTLLWSAKECLLKTSRFAGVSLWNMRSVDVNVVAGSERLTAFRGAAGFASNFEFLRAETTGTGAYQLAVSGNANFVLTAISTNWEN